MPAVLFVCTRNECRSPLASALYLAMLGKRGWANVWRVESAGTWANEGERPVPLALTVARAWGLDITSHRSRNISHLLLESFNLVLTMEQGHKEALCVEFPDRAGRIYLLSEMAGAELNVDDPPDNTLVAYRRMMREIEHWLNRGFDRIVQLSSNVIRA